MVSPLGRRWLAWTLRRPALTALLLLALAAIAVAGASRLKPVPTQDLLVGRGSAVGEATAALERAFGGEPIVVVLEGDLLGTTLAPANLVRVVGLEGRIARTPGVRAVLGPGTFLNTTIVQIERVLRAELGPVAERADRAAARAAAAAARRGASPAQARAAGERARLRSLGRRRAQEYRDLLVRFGAIGFPSLANRAFTAAVVFGSGTEPKERFRFLFADAQHAIVAVRPEAGASEDDLRRLGRRIDALVAGAGLQGLHVTVGGAPLIAAEVAQTTRGELRRLAPALVGAMLVVLLLALGLAPAPVALLGLGLAVAALTAAAGALLGLGLSAATIAALPVVVGLTLDYAVQLSARFAELRRRGAAARAAAFEATRALGGTLGAAGAAMIVGFLVLTASAVPLLDRLGLTLALGTALALSVVLGTGGAVLAALDGRGSRSPRALVLPARLRGAVARLAAPAASGGDVAATGGGLARAGSRRALVAASAVVVLVVAGLVAASQATIQTDVTALAASDSPAVARVKQIQREIGVAGQLRVAVTAPDVTAPPALAWAARAQHAALKVDPRLRPGPDPVRLLGGSAGSAPAPAAVRRLLRLIPPYFLDAAIARDRRLEELSFGVPLTPVTEQARLVEGIERALPDAPAGTAAHPAGLIAAAASSLRSLEHGRPWTLLGAAAIVALVLLGLRRRIVSALLPLVPAVVTAGLSAGVLAALGVRLSPLSASLEPLVLAVGVEFGVLLEARYREARAAGADPDNAAGEAVATVGGPVALSAVTVAVGFFVLVLARLDLLRQFGALVAVEVLVCAAVAITLVPALAAAVDRRSPGARA